MATISLIKSSSILYTQKILHTFSFRCYINTRPVCTTVIAQLCPQSEGLVHSSCSCILLLPHKGEFIRNMRCIFWLWFGWLSIRKKKKKTAPKDVSALSISNMWSAMALRVDSVGGEGISSSSRPLVQSLSSPYWYHHFYTAAVAFNEDKTSLSV